MFSGKTWEMIRRLDRCRYAKLPFLVFKPKLDDRYGATDCISTHSQFRLPAHPVAAHSPLDILTKCNEAKQLGDPPRVVGIDEAQFFDRALVQVCETLANEGLRVIVAGLDLDFQARPFGPMGDLMAIADGGVSKTTAICECGNLATRSHRVALGRDQVQVGGDEAYVPLCRVCYLAKHRSPKPG